MKRALWVALLVAGCFWALNRDVGLDLADDGFYWYGVDAVNRGEVPLRDFQSYMPGRYYWGAVWTNVFGDGPVDLRTAGSLFYALCLMLALAAASSVLVRAWHLAWMGALAACWVMIPSRYVESAWPLAALFVCQRFLRHPDRWRHVALGAFAGFSLFWGLNHGWYCALACQGALIYSAWRTGVLRSILRQEAYFIGGYAAGLLPLVVMLLFIPGFSAALSEQVSWLGSSGWARVKMPIAVIWPWQVSFQDLSADLPAYVRVLEGANRMAISLCFAAAAGLLAAGWWRALTGKSRMGSRESFFAASLLVASAYARHYFIRAELAYLGEGWVPCLFLGAFFVSRLWEIKKAAAILLGSVLVVLTLAAGSLRQVFWYKVFASEGLSSVTLRGDRLYLEKEKAAQLSSFTEWAASYLVKDQRFMAAPMAAALYPIAEQAAPVRWTYFALTLPPRAAEEVRDQLSDPRTAWAIIGDFPIEGRPELRFSSAHREAWSILERDFKIERRDVLPGYHLYRRNSV